MTLQYLTSPEDIAIAHEAIIELRPHLTDKDTFVKQVQAQQKEGYQLVGLFDKKEMVACMGYRFITMLAWGKVLYVDDLITKASHRQNGYGSKLLDHAKGIAKEQECTQVHLDTGYNRHAAHKAYLKKGFEFCCHHLALNLAPK